MNRWKQIALYTLAVAAVSAALTRYYFPQIQTQVKIEEKEVIKKDIRTIIKERVNPDGSSEKETEIIDKSKEKSSKTVEAVKVQQKQWFISGGSTVTAVKPIYDLQVNRRILGPFYLGSSYNTNKELKVHLGYEF